jgi:transcriptional regulator with PAS, ATPase and Fis domain
MSYSNFQSFNVEKYMGAEDIKNIIDLMIKYITSKAQENNHALSYDEIVKVLNAFWWKSNIRDAVIQGVYVACHSGNNNN